MSNRKEYEKKVKEKLEELEKEVDALREKISSAGAELAPEQHPKVETLHKLKEEAKEKFNELLEAGDDAWENLQEGVEHYWTALGNELKAFDKMD